MGKFKQPKKMESTRNVERDRLAFVDAIKKFEIREIDAEFDEESLKSLVSELGKAKLFLLGETHGVKENADIIYTLFKKFGFKKLALEWNEKLRECVEKFLQTGELDFEAIKDSPDGTITAGHFALLKKLKDEGLLEALVCFDGETPSVDWDMRDANMAKNIIANLTDGPTLVVAGNLHTKVDPIPWDEKKEKQTILNRIGEQSSLFRDKKIVSDILQAFKTHKRVFVVYGASHASMQEPAFKKAFESA